MKKIFVFVAAAALVGFFGCSPKTSTNTPVDQGISGVISHDTTWNTSAHVVGDLTIHANVVWSRKITVTVDEGVVIAVDGSGSLTVHEGVKTQFATGADMEVGYSGAGTLIAQGSDSLPVLFTHQAGVTNWGSDKGGIVIFNNASANNNLDNCIIEYATSGIYDDGIPVAITRCKIRNNQAFGIDFVNDGAEPKDSASFIKDSITGNGSYAITMQAEAVRNLSGDTYFSGNTKAGIRIEGGDVTKNATWKKHATPYVVTAQVTVANATGVILRINPGTVLQFDAAAYFDVGHNNEATFIANGTTTDSIKFTTTTPGAFWGNTGNESGGFVFWGKTTTVSSLTYCVIDSAVAGVDLWDAAMTISNNTIRNNQTSGLVFASPAATPNDSASFVNNAITGNGSYAIEIYSSELGNLSGTGTVAGNTKGGIFVTGDGVTKDATWKKHDASYIVDGTVAVDDPTGPTVTIRPGSKFELVKDASFDVGYSDAGAIIANGTPTDSIIFTNKVTGTYWGVNSNEAGGFQFWGGTASTSLLKYCVINSATCGIYDDGPVTVENCSITNCQTYGVTFFTDATPNTVSGNFFHGNVVGDTATNP